MKIKEWMPGTYKTYEVSMGVGAVPLHEQLAEQGLSLGRASSLRCSHLDADMSYIRQLWLHGFLDDKERKSAETRLMKYITTHVEEDRDKE